MKKILFSAAIIFATNFAFGQITLEHSFSDSESVQNYSNANTMFYVSIKNNENMINIYNADFTLRKTINVPLPANYKMSMGSNYYEASPYSISKNIFNTDDKYEFIIEAGYFDNSNQKIYKKLLIIDEDGNLLKDFHPNAGMKNFFDLYYIFHDSTTNKNKILIENRIEFNEYPQFDVYSLPTSELTSKEIQGKNKLSAFPIPTNKILNIINPKNGTNKIEIFDNSGKLVLSKNFANSENKISLDLENLPKGIYMYKIGEQTSKFIKN